MQAAKEWYKDKVGDRVNLKHLAFGFGAVALIYLGITAFVFLQSSKTIAWLEDRLASKTTIVADEAPKPKPVVKKEKPKPVAEHHPKEAHPAPAKTEHQEEHEKTALHPAPAAESHHAPPAPHEEEHHPAPAETPKVEKAIPLDGLYEETQYGLLPKVRVLDRMTPFDAYKTPVIQMGKPKIGIVVHDFGLSQSDSEMALKELPPEVTMLVSSYAKKPDEWREKAQKSGHETWLYMPFETENSAYNDPGPQALLTTVSLKNNEKNMKENLGYMVGYPGVAASTDYVFANSKMMLKPLVTKMYDRGLAFLELNPNAPDTIENMNAKDLAPYIKADIVINGENEQSHGSPLKELERIAQSNGKAIGVLYPHPSSLKQISVWLNSLPGKGFVLMPVSALSGPAIPQAHDAGEEETEHHE